MKTTQDRKLSQLDNAIQALADMEIDITAEDRKAAAIELKLSGRTVHRYIKRKGGYDLDTAATLVAFFRGRIQARDKLIGLLK